MADLKWFIIIILAFWFLSKSGFGFLGGINTKAPDTNNTNTTGKSFSSQSRAQILETPKAEDNNSKWKDMVRISAGSASGANYPNQEYITLQNISGDKNQ